MLNFAFEMECILGLGHLTATFSFSLLLPERFIDRARLRCRPIESIACPNDRQYFIVIRTKSVPNEISPPGGHP